MLQLLPFQVSARALTSGYVEAPTATHRLGDVHEPELRTFVSVWAGLGDGSREECQQGPSSAPRIVSPPLGMHLANRR